MGFGKFSEEGNTGKQGEGCERRPGEEKPGKAQDLAGRIVC